MRVISGQEAYELLHITEHQLYDALRQIGTAHLYPMYLTYWEKYPVAGNCQLVSELVFRYLAPAGTQIYAIDAKSGLPSEHWFVMHKNDQYIIDIACVPGKSYDYHRAKFRLLQAERNLCKQLAAYMGVTERRRDIPQNRFGRIKNPAT